jgi:hypothetical protein
VAAAGWWAVLFRLHRTLHGFRHLESHAPFVLSCGAVVLGPNGRSHAQRAHPRARYAGDVPHLNSKSS